MAICGCSQRQPPITFTYMPVPYFLHSFTVCYNFAKQPHVNKILETNLKFCNLRVPTSSTMVHSLNGKKVVLDYFLRLLRTGTVVLNL